MMMSDWALALMAAATTNRARRAMILFMRIPTVE
jgi:hypothetical protein